MIEFAKEFWDALEPDTKFLIIAGYFLWMLVFIWAS